MDCEDAVFLDVCKGIVTYRISLSAADTTTPNPPDVLLPVPRNSYLPLHMDIAHQTWEAHTTTLPGSPRSFWVEYGSEPVAWHLPAGVVHDRILSQDPHATLPLRLTAHYSSFPLTKVVPFWEQGFESQFRHVMKGSVCCMYDRPSAFMQHPSPTLFSDTDAMIKTGSGAKTLMVHRSIRGYAGAMQRYPLVVHLGPNGASSFHGVAATSVTSDTTLQEALKGVGVVWEDTKAVVVQGMPMCPEVPFIFCMFNLVCADMALHVVITMQQRKE